MQGSKLPSIAPRTGAGFSLVEVLVVVVIVGILGAVAVPGYQNYVRESRRSDAWGALLTMANEQEKFHLANGAYASTLASVWDQGATSLEDYYTLNVASGTAAAFTVQARVNPAESQVGDTDCGCIELTSTNAKNSYVATNCTGTNIGDACW